jgi:hypothetical protein
MFGSLWALWYHALAGCAAPDLGYRPRCSTFPPPTETGLGRRHRLFHPDRADRTSGLRRLTDALHDRPQARHGAGFGKVRRSIISGMTWSWWAPAAPGLRATLGMAEQGLKTACVSKVFPTRSHTVAAQGGIAASARQHGAGPLALAHVRHGEGLRLAGRHRRDGIPRARGAQGGLRAGTLRRPFSRTEEGKIYQRPFGGHTTEFGEGPPVQRTCAAADRTGHAILHTLYGQSLKNNAEFYIEYFATDLLMTEDGNASASWPGSSTTARSTSSAPRWSCWPPAATAAPISPPPPPIPAPAMAAAWSRARACRCRTWNSCSSTPPASTAPAASSPRARAARAATSPIPRASGSWNAMRRPTRTSPPATWSAAA